MEERIERLKKWAEGNPQPPVGIELAPTLRCNLNCKFCWRGKEDFGKTDKEMKERELSLERYKEIIREAGEIGVEEVRVIGGGEPLFRSETLEIMEEIKENDLYGYICTNGMLFSENMIERLTDLGWDHVKFSIHGLKETHNGIVGGKVFEKVIKNVERFADSETRVEIGMVIVNENFKEVEALLNLAKDLGVDDFFLEPITVYSKLGEKLKLRKAEEKKLREKLRKLSQKAENWEITTNFREFIRNNLVEKTNEMKKFIYSQVDQDSDSFAELPCYEPFLRMGIRVDGRVAPCGFYDQERGDSAKNKSLKEVWYGNYFRDRRKEQKNKKLPDYCSKCCTTLVNKQNRIRKRLSEVV